MQRDTDYNHRAILTITEDAIISYVDVDDLEVLAAFHERMSTTRAPAQPPATLPALRSLVCFQHTLQQLKADAESGGEGVARSAAMMALVNGEHDTGL